MPTRREHYQAAEARLAEGVEVVVRISNLHDERQALKIKMDSTEDVLLAGVRADIIGKITAQMDELGKKTMGIWAQAQVHATLASAPLEFDSSSPATLVPRDPVPAFGAMQTTEKTYGSE